MATKRIGELIRAKVNDTPGMSSKLLAEKLGMHEQTIYDIYKREAIHTDILSRIAKILDVPVVYFLENATEPEVPHTLALDPVENPPTTNMQTEPKSTKNTPPNTENTHLHAYIQALEERLRDKELIIRLLLEKLRQYGEDYRT